ncbi:MAG: hypothetical protein J6I73_06880 [Treponema sp.]|nr:hypothetical protein [Treponema sp.]
MGKNKLLAWCVAAFSLPLAAQTSLDRRTIAAMYGLDYTNVPSRETVQLPDLLQGIWRGSDRYVFFVPPQRTAYEERTADDDIAHGEVQISRALAPSDVAVVLKTYYGWFYDRAAEPEAYAASERFLCTATTKEAERITIAAEPLQSRPPRLDEDGNSIPYTSGAWELVVTYNGKTKYETRIPVAVIGNELYLDFIIKGDTDDMRTSSANNNLFGFWQGVCKRSDFQIAPYPRGAEVTSYYVLDDAVYTLRYWETTMPYTDTYASFTDGDESFHVQKHIVSSGSVFTCVTGRSTRIRNIAKSSAPFMNYTLDSTGTICAFGEPYLIKVTGAENADALIAIVNEANARRKPDPPPLFPPSNLNWHWDIITLLEKDNKLIQEVRARQRAFAATNGESGRIDALQASIYSSHIKLQQEAFETISQGAQ